ncbi:DUF6480 family protein [Streptomyces sp. NK08204]|uniref:DUF6480 family protein n=1 Tax=Streptomyces sp. NK08204 TaxID=2873260 RepID=UPI001CEDDE79|nr:DUF6480 family protein [Streptomyces sp. NK08204]
MNAKGAHGDHGPRRSGRTAPESGGTADVPATPVEGLSVPGDATPAPGATPPAESGMSGLGAPEREALRRGWAVAPLMLIWIVVLLVVIGLVAMVVVLITG